MRWVWGAVCGARTSGPEGWETGKGLRGGHFTGQAEEGGPPPENRHPWTTRPGSTEVAEGAASKPAGGPCRRAHHAPSARTERRGNDAQGS